MKGKVVFANVEFYLKPAFKISFTTDFNKIGTLIAGF